MLSLEKCRFAFITAVLTMMAGPAFAGTPAGPTTTSITIQPVQQLQGEPKFWIGGGVEAWSGENTYQIGYPATDYYGTRYEGHFPFSELKYPLDAYFGVIKVGGVYKDKYIVNGLLKKSISNSDGNLEDSDWITESNPSRLDIYSYSDVTDFEGMVVDVDFSYKFLQREKGWLAAGAGYMFQDFEYNAAIVSQWSPSGLSGWDYEGDGSDGLTYDVEYSIPYLLLSGQAYVSSKFKLSGRLAYSPMVRVEDRDEHLWRYKENRGELDGDAFMLALDGQYDFNEFWFMTAGLSYTLIEAEGDSKAYFYGYYDHTVSEEIESKQSSLFMMVGYKIGGGAIE